MWNLLLGVKGLRDNPSVTCGDSSAQGTPCGCPKGEPIIQKVEPEQAKLPFSRKAKKPHQKEVNTVPNYKYRATAMSGKMVRGTLAASDPEALLNELKKKDQKCTKGRMIMPKIIRNAIRCKKCGDVIESKTVHDFKFCSCGSCAVDGGHDYLRRCGDLEDWEELSEVEKLENNGALT